MAIFEFFDQESKQEFTETFDSIDESVSPSSRSHFFSTLITRFCFLLLLIADLAWLIYNFLMLGLSLVGFAVTGGKNAFFRRGLKKFFLHLRRSLVCALSLVTGLFCPPFGIMIACTYFLMYDKAGMEEVVPTPLQAQFKDLFNTER